MSLITNKKISKVYLGSKMLYSSGNVVTYHVDSNTKYTEEFGDGESVLSAKSFIPSKSGWTFVGWREDTAATKDVLSSKIMGDEPITLYAVFSKTCTLTAKSYNNTQTVDGNAYYNNGNTTTATVYVPTGATYSGWSWRGWSSWNSGTGADASVQFSNGQRIDIGDVDRTIYGLYEKALVQTFINGNGTTATTAYAYYNASGNTKDATITMPSVDSKSGWSIRGWSDNNANAEAAVDYSGGETNVKCTIENKFYALYQQTIYLYYNGNGSTSGSVSTQSGTRYYNAYGNTSNPSFKLASNGYSRSGYTFTGWSLGAVGATITLTGNTTAYAQWVANPFYAIQNGVVNKTYAPNASAWTDGYSRGSGTITDGNCTYYGGHGHPNDDGQNWGADTGNITTNGLKKLYIQPFMNNWSVGPSGSLTVYGNGAAIYSAQIPRDSQSSWSKTLDIASYSNIRVYINCSSDEDIWINCGLITVYLHN